MKNLEQKIRFENRIGQVKEQEKFRLEKYVYRDNSAGGEIIFECISDDILKADKAYQEETGKDPEKQSHIGCSIEKIDVRDIKT